MHCRYVALTFSIVLILGLRTPSLAHESEQLEKIQASLSAKRYAEAVTMLKAEVERGNPKALWMLGDLYMHGRGVPRNFKNARYLWEKATVLDDPNGMCSLALLLSVGLGAPTDIKRAISLFKRSADKGCAQAQYYMGLESIWRSAVKPDYPLAVRYFDSAAKSRNGNAECMLAYLYENGLGVAKDAQRAAALMKLAKTHGCADAESAIGRVYFRGIGTATDYSKAYHWFSAGAADGSPRAMSDLAGMYADGKGVKANPQKAVELYIDADKNGYPAAAYNLAERYRTGGSIPKDLKKAKALYEELARSGDNASAERLKLCVAT